MSIHFTCIFMLPWGEGVCTGEILLHYMNHNSWLYNTKLVAFKPRKWQSLKDVNFKEKK